MAPKPQIAIERFRSKTREVDSGCIEWTAYRGENGYGRFYFEGRGALAHRWIYEYHNGKIRPGLQVDHLCRNRGCVNVEHLEAVTPSENVRRGMAGEVARNRYAQITHCPSGHEYTPENTYIGGHGRSCLECKRSRRRAHYAENRELYKARAAAWKAANPEKYLQVQREAQRRYRKKLKEA